VVFTLMSAPKWSEEDRAKQLLDELAEPLMQVSERIPERRLVVRQGLSISLKSVLTPREREIVEALGKGCTNKEIARYLGTSPNTVRNQLARLTEKVGARSRAQLALLAQKG
jgi:DNA-binding CsgD family transcriptional regulator